MGQWGPMATIQVPDCSQGCIPVCVGLSRPSVAETRLDARAKPKQLRKWVEVGDERREADQRRSQAEAGVEANTCSQ